MQQYFEETDKKVAKVFENCNSLDETEPDTSFRDIALTNFIAKYKREFAFTNFLKNIQMKTGESWQIILGNYSGFKDLGIGSGTGLDIISEERHIIMELKNRDNTDSSSSKKTNLDKLVKFKSQNPDYTCVYGHVNISSKAKSPRKGYHKTIKHKGVDIEIYAGKDLFDFVFGDNATPVISHYVEFFSKMKCLC
jgi:hypothetical protein